MQYIYVYWSHKCVSRYSHSIVSPAGLALVQQSLSLISSQPLQPPIAFFFPPILSLIRLSLPDTFWSAIAFINLHCGPYAAHKQPISSL